MHKLKCRVKFLENAQDFYTFPITQSIRMSLWIHGGEKSIFSEIQILKPIFIGEKYDLIVLFPEVDYISENINLKAQICFGTYPAVCGLGEILQVFN